MRTVEIKIKDGDKVIYIDIFKLGDGYTRTFGTQFELINTPKYPHDDELVMTGYEFKPTVINLKPAPKESV